MWKMRNAARGRLDRGGGMVTRTKPNRSNQGRSGVLESVGSMRKEGNIGSGAARGGNTGGSDNRGRNTRNLPYPEFLK